MRKKENDNSCPACFVEKVQSVSGVKLTSFAFKSCLFILPCKEGEMALVKRFQKTILPRIGSDSPISFGWIRFTGLYRLAESTVILQGCMDCASSGKGRLV